MQPAFIASRVFHAPMLRVVIDCREARTCLTDTGFSLPQLKLYEGTEFAALFCEVSSRRIMTTTRNSGHGCGTRCSRRRWY